MKKKALVLLLLLMLSTLMLAACGNPIVGKWQMDDDSGMIYVFEAGGSFSMHTPDKEEWAITGTYTCHGDQVTLTLMGQATTLNYRIEGDVLTLTGNNVDDVLHRVTGVTP